MAKNLCGICTRMPAPSPARGSAPTAPRCSRLTRMVSASSTILCDLRPLMSAMNPTPQESFSSAGSNRPNPAALIVRPRTPHRAPNLGRGLGACRQRRVASSCARAIQSSWRQPSCRLQACGCFFAAVRRALASPADSSPRVTAAWGASPIGTAMLSYAEHGKFPATTQGQSPRERDEKVPKAHRSDADCLPRSATVSGPRVALRRNGPPALALRASAGFEFAEARSAKADRRWRRLQVI